MRVTSSAVILAYLATSHAWVLDSSCSAYSDMVKAGFQGGFDLAQAGSDLFSKITPTGSGATWQAQKDLISYMFAEALNNGNIDTTNAKWQTASKQFTSVLKYNSNNGQPDTTPANYRSLNTDGLIVFCDYSRFKEDQNCDGVAKKGITCDTTIGISWPMNDIYSNCKSTSVFSSTSVEAWTYEFASLGVNRASQIQLCPGFLKETQKGKVQSLQGQGKKSSLARGWKKFTSWVDDPFRTPMDVAYTFDATILHEMTHAVPNAATEDAGGKGDSYGWKNCNKMTNSGGTKNADSYSFFGLGARMISPTNGGTAQRPMSDGSIQVLAAAGSSKRDLDLRARTIPNTTVIIDNTTVVLNASNTAGFVVAPPSTSPVTVSTGREYTIGTDVVSLGGSAVIIDHSTKFLPVASASVTSGVVTSSASKSSNGSSSITSITGISTFSTSTRSQNSSSSIPSSSGISTSSSSSRGQNSSTSVSFLSTSSRSSSVSSSGSSGLTSGSKSSTSGTSSSRSQSLTGSGTSTDSQNSTTGISTSGSSSVSSGTKSGSSSSSKPASNTASTSTSSLSSSASLSGSTSTSKSGSNTVSTTGGSTTAQPTSNTAVETITSGSSTSVVPITVINVSKSGTTSPVTYISTFTSSGDIKPTGAWMCTGPLCDSGSNCIIPLFCGSESGSSSSWGLCCGWNPPSPPGGGGPPAGGPSPGPPGNNNDPTGSGSESATKTDTSTNTDSKSSTSTSSSSSCSTQTASACDTSLSVFTPTGASTASTSTVTLSCSTVTACSATLTGSATTTTGNTELTATPIGDYFLAWDSAEPSWYDVQQSVLSEAEADDTEPYITWSSDEVYVSYNPSSTSNSTAPASTSASPTSKSATLSGTLSGPASSTVGSSMSTSKPASSSNTSLKPSSSSIPQSTKPSATSAPASTYCSNPSLEDGDGLCTCNVGTYTTTITPSGGPGNSCPTSFSVPASSTIPSSTTPKPTSTAVSSSTVKPSSTSAQCKTASDCGTCPLAGEVAKCLDDGTCSCATAIS